jgi:hypothetical protein
LILAGTSFCPPGVDWGSSWAIQTLPILPATSNPPAEELHANSVFAHRSWHYGRIESTIFEGLSLVGGKGAFRSTWTKNMVGGRHIFRGCNFVEYLIEFARVSNGYRITPPATRPMFTRRSATTSSGDIIGPAVSNLPGYAIPFDPDLFLAGSPEVPAVWQRGDDPGYQPIVSLTGKDMLVSGAGQIKAAADAHGGETAAEFTASAKDAGLAVRLDDTKQLQEGRVGFIEVELKRADAAPLDTVYLWLVHNFGQSSERVSARTVRLQANWQRITLPFVIRNLDGGMFHLVLLADQFQKGEQERFLRCSRSLRFKQPNISEMDLVPFCGQADRARNQVALRCLVHLLAVDLENDPGAVSDDLVEVPLAWRFDRPLGLLQVGQLTELRVLDRFQTVGRTGQPVAVQPPEVALVAGVQLGFQAFGPDPMFAGHAKEHAAVARLSAGRGPPLEREHEIRVVLAGIEVPERLSFAHQDSIGPQCPNVAGFRLGIFRKGFPPADLAGGFLTGEHWMAVVLGSRE